MLLEVRRVWIGYPVGFEDSDVSWVLGFDIEHLLDRLDTELDDYEKLLIFFTAAKEYEVRKSGHLPSNLEDLAWLILYTNKNYRFDIKCLTDQTAKIESQRQSALMKQLKRKNERSNEVAKQKRAAKVRVRRSAIDQRNNSIRFIISDN